MLDRALEDLSGKERLHKFCNGQHGDLVVISVSPEVNFKITPLSILPSVGVGRSLKIQKHLCGHLQPICVAILLDIIMKSPPNFPNIPL